jgi:hypothetical protein
VNVPVVTLPDQGGVRKILCEKYISYIFHVFSEARDHILILNILFFNKLREIIPEIRSERRDLLIFIFINKKRKIN